MKNEDTIEKEIKESMFDITGELSKTLSNVLVHDSDVVMISDYNTKSDYDTVIANRFHEIFPDLVDSTGCLKDDELSGYIVYISKEKDETRNEPRQN